MFKNLLKKSFALLAVCVVSLGTETAASETSEWSLYLWSNTTSSGSEAGSFESTPDENVFILKNCNLTESGITIAYTMPLGAKCMAGAQTVMA